MVFKKNVKIVQTVKIVKRCQRRKLSKWSNIVKIVNIVKNCQICQNCQVLRKFSKLSKIVKIVKIVENCRFCQFCASGESGQSAGSVQSGPHLLTKTFQPKIEEKNQQTFAGTTFIAVVFSVSFSRNVAMSMGRPFSGSLQNKVYSAHRWGRRWPPLRLVTTQDCCWQPWWWWRWWWWWLWWWWNQSLFHIRCNVGSKLVAPGPSYMNQWMVELKS